MAARQFKSSHDRTLQRSGETFVRERDGDDSHEVRGIRDPKKRMISFSSEADVQVGDLLRSAVSGVQMTVTTIEPYTLSDTVVYLLASYETPQQRAERVEREQRQTPSITIGTVQGSILNLSSQLTNVTQIIGTLPGADQPTKDALAELTKQLSEVLGQVPVEHAEEAERVSERVEGMAKEARKSKPDHAYLAVTAEGLKKAAANLAEVLPSVLPIATQIADLLLKAAPH